MKPRPSEEADRGRDFLAEEEEAFEEAYGTRFRLAHSFSLSFSPSRAL